ncbi:MAG: phosphoglycerate dehydrogenase, partial [Sediminibacterium sp.]|nr:phosphoglycerate dehydrogenase [Sediminibacterium sp.]
MKNKKVFLLENIHPQGKKIFLENGYLEDEIFCAKGGLSNVELEEILPYAEVLGIRSKTLITEQHIKVATNLKAIGCFCIGTNQVNIKAATQFGIAVFNAPYSNTRSVAELVIGSMIMLIRRIPEKNQAVHQKVWAKDATNCREVRGKTLGIIGYGNIGIQVGILAEALGVKVIYFDIETKLPFGNAQPAESLIELVKKSDIISIHVPSTILTKNLFNKELISQCKYGSIVINFSRGEVVDLNALKNAIQSQNIHGAAIDVYPFEPEKNGDIFECPLQNLKNVLLTPHIGGSTEEAQENISIDVSTKMINYVNKAVSLGSLTVPALQLPTIEGKQRIANIHHNEKGMLSAINSILAQNDINILGQYLKTNEEIGYVVFDVDQKINKDIIEKMNAI